MKKKIIFYSLIAILFIYISCSPEVGKESSNVNLPYNVLDSSSFNLVDAYFQSENELLIIFNKPVSEQALDKSIYTITPEITILSVRFTNQKQAVILKVEKSTNCTLEIDSKLKDINGNSIAIKTKTGIRKFDINWCIVINEVFPDAYNYDTNRDGIMGKGNKLRGWRDADVFIELYNRSCSNVNIKGYKIFVRNQYNTNSPIGVVKHTFDEDLIIPPKKFCTIWNGGNPTGFEEPYVLCNASDQYKLNLMSYYKGPLGTLITLQNSQGSNIDQVGYGTEYCSDPAYSSYKLIGKAMMRYPDGADNWIEAVYPFKPYSPQAPNTIIEY